MKIGDLNMHCGECDLIDYCGDPWSDIAICMETRLEKVDEEVFYKYLENAQGETKQDTIDNAYFAYVTRDYEEKA